MSNRSQFNIGQTEKTSVKVHHNPGGQSNWSFGWQEQGKKEQQLTKQAKYHNQSNVLFGDKSQVDQHDEEKKKKDQQRKKKEQQMNQKLPEYDPKKGHQTNVFFGNQKTDYRKKDEVFTSVKVKNPPGGKSNIQFG